MLNKCLLENKIPTQWRQSKIIAILTLGRTLRFQRVTPLCHTYKLYEIMNFRPGKSCTSQLLNLTQHIEDGYQENMITGTSFVDLSAEYDTMNHILLMEKHFNITQDSTLCSYSEPSAKQKILWGAEQRTDRDYRRMACHKGVFSPQLFSTYTLMISQSMIEQ